MVKYAIVNKCGEECPHYDIDPQTDIQKFWGEHVCCGCYDDEMRIIDDFGKEDFPVWCPLDGPNDL